MALFAMAYHDIIVIATSPLSGGWRMRGCSVHPVKRTFPASPVTPPDRMETPPTPQQEERTWPLSAPQTTTENPPFYASKHSKYPPLHSRRRTKGHLPTPPSKLYMPSPPPPVPTTFVAPQKDQTPILFPPKSQNQTVSPIMFLLPLRSTTHLSASSCCTASSASPGTTAVAATASSAATAASPAATPLLPL